MLGPVPSSPPRCEILGTAHLFTIWRLTRGKGGLPTIHTSYYHFR